MRSGHILQNGRRHYAKWKTQSHKYCIMYILSRIGDFIDIKKNRIEVTRADKRGECEWGVII